MATPHPHTPPTKGDLSSARKTIKSASPASRAIVDNIESKKGPVGKGKHNDIRTQALLDWLAKHPNPKKAADSEANDTPKHERTEPSKEKKREGD